MSEVITYYGMEKTGKTTFGFSAIRDIQGDMVHFDFDLGRDRAIWRFPKALADRIKTVEFPEVPTWTLGSGAITQSWARFELIFETALNDPNVGALFIDTGTQMHKLNADEYLENYVKRNKPNRTQLQQMEYRIPNSRTRAKYMAARGAHKLLIVSHYEADVYKEQFVQRADGSMSKESVKTGIKIHAGFGETPYLTSHHLQLNLKTFEDGKLGTVAKILTPNPPLAMGIEIENPTYGKLITVIDGVKRMSMMEE